jgi:hypothetical protein
MPTSLWEWAIWLVALGSMYAGLGQDEEDVSAPGRPSASANDAGPSGTASEPFCIAKEPTIVGGEKLRITVVVNDVVVELGEVIVAEVGNTKHESDRSWLGGAVTDVHRSGLAS